MRQCSEDYDDGLDTEKSSSKHAVVHYIMTNYKEAKKSAKQDGPSACGGKQVGQADPIKGNKAKAKAKNTIQVQKAGQGGPKKAKNAKASKKGGSKVSKTAAQKNKASKKPTGKAKNTKAKKGSYTRRSRVNKGSPSKTRGKKKKSKATNKALKGGVKWQEKAIWWWQYNKRSLLYQRCYTKKSSSLRDSSDGVKCDKSLF